nr:MAG TPA: hypothetical protein [Caudoviricetes sp.]
MCFLKYYGIINTIYGINFSSFLALFGVLF